MGPLAIFLSVGIIGGIAFYLFRRYEHPTYTGPSLTVLPSYNADISTITNITNTVTAITPKTQDS